MAKKTSRSASVQPVSPDEVSELLNTPDDFPSMTEEQEIEIRSMASEMMRVLGQEGAAKWFVETMLLPEEEEIRASRAVDNPTVRMLNWYHETYG